MQYSRAGEEACCLRLLFPDLEDLEVGKAEDFGLVGVHAAVLASVVNAVGE